MNSSIANAQAIASFVTGMRTRQLPEEVVDAAHFCIVDWYGVALGAAKLPPVDALSKVVRDWQGQGASRVLSGGTANAPSAALVNGMMAHCLDFDDTHVGSISHLSGPAWAAAFAAAMDAGCSPEKAMRGFIAGFEVGAHVGGQGFGVATNERHTHATGVFGCLAAAAAAACIYELDESQIVHAMGLAATQVAGLTGSFGTPAKPFHAGKAAFNGVLAAQMARNGYAGATNLLEPGSGMDKALVQDGSVTIQGIDFASAWEVTRNTFKPYASCLLTHPVIDACRTLHAANALGAGTVRTVKVIVNPLAIQLAGKLRPTTPYEGKFSLSFTSALALAGKRATQHDFLQDSINDAALQALVKKVELVAAPDMPLTAASVEIVFDDGSTQQAHTPLALGNPGRPMAWSDMNAKFLSLVTPVLGAAGAETLFGRLRHLGRADWASLNEPLTQLQTQEGR